MNLKNYFDNERNISKLIFILKYFSFLIPAKRLVNKYVIAFKHPKPSWENHLLVLPRKKISNLSELANEENAIYAKEIFKALELLTGRHEYENDFIIVANGGWRQEVKQTHFHLYNDKTFKLSSHDKHNVIFNKPTLVCKYFSSSKYKNFSLVPKKEMSDISCFSDDFVRDILESIVELDKRFNLEKLGYSLIISKFESNGKSKLAVNVVSD